MGRWNLMLGAMLGLLILSPAGHAAEKRAGRDTLSRPDRAKALEAKMDRMGPIMSDIGLEAASLVGGDPDGVFLYVEIVDGQPHAILCRNREKSVRVFAGSPRLSELIEEAWVLVDTDPLKRWAVMEYAVQGTKFDMLVRYAEEIDPAVSAPVRFRAVLADRFGRKRLIRDASLKETEERPSKAVFRSL